MSCDVSELAQVQDLASHARATFGRLDVWVNNAGVSGAFGPTLRLPPGRFMSVIRTNIVGVYNGSYTAMQHFTQQRNGKLINLLGRGDRKPVPLQNAYASSKSWVRSFTLALAKEYRDSGVGVYAFNPGLVLTELLTDVDVVQGYEERVKGLETVMRLWANPPEVAAHKALWLASPATDGRTALVVDVLTPARIAGGILREGLRRLRRQPTPRYPVNIRTIQ
jgi:NAD(P)-dependent dehydrogenase (short-subunit alcohol dehydrogenase family)